MEIYKQLWDINIDTLKWEMETENITIEQLIYIKNIFEKLINEKVEEAKTKYLKEND